MLSYSSLTLWTLIKRLIITVMLLHTVVVVVDHESFHVSSGSGDRYLI